MSNPSEPDPGHDAEGTNADRHALERFEVARKLWDNLITREQLLAHWLAPEHPDRSKFLENREAIEEALSSYHPIEELRLFMQSKGFDLDAVAAQIPAITDEAILADRDLQTMQDQFTLSKPHRHDERDQRLKSSIESELEMMRRRRHGRGLRGGE